jgi:hypothetical protein
MKYKPGKKQDYLRIMLDRANTKIKLTRSDKKGDEITSYSINEGEV